MRKKASDKTRRPTKALVISIALLALFLIFFIPHNMQTTALSAVWPTQSGFEIQTPSGTKSYLNAWDAINDAISSSTSDSVFIKSGFYPIGRTSNIMDDVSWTAAKPSISINNVAGKEDSKASQISISDPDDWGVIAYYNFPAPIDLSAAWAVTFWLKPSVDLATKATGTYGSQLKFLIDDSPSVTSPLFSECIYHPEWSPADSWKNYMVPAKPPAARGFSPTSAWTNIRSIGIALSNQDYCSGAIDQNGPYSITVDDVHMNEGTIRVKGGIRLLGAGVGNTTLRLNDNVNIPMVVVKGDNVEIAGLELDGNFDNQQAIDMCMGIIAQDGVDNLKVHHNYIHHTKGGGVKVRAANIEIYENLIEWTENPNIELTYHPTFAHIHHNTLRYAINDDNIWINNAHDITIEYNLLYGVTAGLLASGDPSIPQMWRNKQPAAWNGIRLQETYNNLIQYNKIYNAPSISIAHAGGYDTTIQYNQLYYGGAHYVGGHQLRVENWKGASTRVHVIANLAVSGFHKGISIAGSNCEIKDNWSKDNADGGIFIGGSENYGSGNYAEESNNGAPINFMSSSPPSLPQYEAGCSLETPEEVPGEEIPQQEEENATIPEEPTEPSESPLLKTEEDTYFLVTITSIAIGAFVITYSLRRKRK